MKVESLIQFYHQQPELLKARLLIYWGYVAHSKSSPYAPLFQDLLGHLMLDT